jgi:hypothetical protein
MHPVLIICPKTISFLSVVEQKRPRIVYLKAAVIAFITGSSLSPVLSESCASIVQSTSIQERCVRAAIVLLHKT